MLFLWFKQQLNVISFWKNVKGVEAISEWQPNFIDIIMAYFLQNSVNS